MTLWGPIDPVATQLAATRDALGRAGFQLHQNQRSNDTLTWPHASKIFKLKQKISVILSDFGLTNATAKAPTLLVFEGHPTISSKMRKEIKLPPEHISEIIEMALSDHVSFADIKAEYGISDKQVKTLMRDELKSSSYKAWRKRVRDFGERREAYK